MEFERQNSAIIKSPIIVVMLGFTVTFNFSKFYTFWVFFASLKMCTQLEFQERGKMNK